MKRKISYRRLLLLFLPLVIVLSASFVIFRPSKKDLEKGSSEKETVERTSYTLSDLMKNTLEPVGQVMYIWGGGWNEEDTAAGEEARTIGMSPNWFGFTQAQDSGYDYEEHLYEIHNGLDCSGYVGWVLYNTMESENGQPGYVALSGVQTQQLVDRGLGSIIPASQITDHETGDLMSNDGHIFIVLKAMEDGSLVIAHSSPPGVKISGTPDAQGDPNSMALKEAEELMNKIAPEWLAKYPDCSVDFSYLTEYDQFRWNDEKMKDPEGIKKMSTAEWIDHLVSLAN